MPSTTGTDTALDAVGAALVDAHDALSRAHDDQRAQDALVRLCRASYDALALWEQRRQVDLDEPATTSWRTSLDELRVQAALAEMELRQAGIPVIPATELISTVTQRMTGAREEIGVALDRLRADLRAHLR